MEYLKVGGAALNQTPLDWDGNRANIVAAIAQAREEEVRVLCLPELCISGYGCEDAFHGEGVAEQSLESLRAILPETRGIAVAVGLPLLHRQHLYNCAALLADGRLAGFSAKMLLAGYGVYYEPRWFKPWPPGQSADHPWEGGSVPIGDLVFDLEGVRVAFEICEDAWGRQAGGAVGSGGGRSAGGSLAAGADLLLNPSASHFAFGKYATVRGIVLEGSRQSHGAYVYANLAGNESGRLIFDGTTLIASDGRMLAENRRFSYRLTQLTTALVNLRANRLERRRLGYSASSEGDRNGGKRAVPVSFAPSPAEADAVRAFRAARPGLHPPEASPSPEASEAPEDSGFSPLLGRHEEFTRAVALGLWDYLRKSRSQGFTVSLSGGVDSSSVAVLCAAMARMALEELKEEGVRERLAHIGNLPGGTGGGKNGAAVNDGAGNGGEMTPRALVGRLLLTAYQASENSSSTTRDAASGVAEAIGSRHVELDIQPLVKQYEGLAEKVLGRPLRWETDDISLQNVQARARSPGIWLLANLEGRLLLSTSNRSEIGVGYATMDGDTSGGLAPIAGANKTFLRGWLAWMEREGAAGVGPLPALAAVNAQQPTAELRPPGEGQEDEKDLMPYIVLDAIEQAAIRDRMAPLEVWRTLMTAPLDGQALSPRMAAGYVGSFFRLWSRTQWKRERMAPSFHLDDENLDPRTWCRFPILAGGYEKELEDLRRVVEEGEIG